MRPDPSNAEKQAATIRLTREEMNPRGGCLAKLRGCDLESLLLKTCYADAQDRPAFRAVDSALIEVGPGGLLVSTDLGPLIGRDLYLAGVIAALHAMSDIYARGGQPGWALPILVGHLDSPLEHLETVMAGVTDACRDEAVLIVGGHTGVGAEALAGMTVLGSPGSSGVLDKRGAQQGDLLLLSKPLGTGMIVRGHKLGLASDSDLEEATETMRVSNRRHANAAVLAGVHAMTDVSGFGLLGHLSEMLSEHIGAVLRLETVPKLPATAHLPAAVADTFWTRGNRAYAAGNIRLNGDLEDLALLPLLDPQTNGGLLVSAPNESVLALLQVGFVVIGAITTTGAIEFR